MVRAHLGQGGLGAGPSWPWAGEVAGFQLLSVAAGAWPWMVVARLVGVSNEYDRRAESVRGRGRDLRYRRRQTTARAVFDASRGDRADRRLFDRLVQAQRPGVLAVAARPPCRLALGAGRAWRSGGWLRHFLPGYPSRPERLRRHAAAGRQFGTVLFRYVAVAVGPRHPGDPADRRLAGRGTAGAASGEFAQGRDQADVRQIAGRTHRLHRHRPQR